MNTIFALILYLIASQIPLYGASLLSSGGDYFNYIRAILAANRGTLMELGVSPIVTSSMIVQVLINTNIINLNKHDENDKKRYDSLQKFSAILLILIESIAYTLTGTYGNVDTMGIANAVLVILQLMFASVMVMLLDEVINKHGHGNGISLFIAINISESLLWKLLSPIYLEETKDYEGLFVNIVYQLFYNESYSDAFYNIMLRENNSNLLTLISTLFIILMVV